MPRPTVEVADIFRRYGNGYRTQHRLPLQQHRVMRAIETCRTSALGGHLERCGHCEYQRVSYNSCRNRHCPKCQNAAQAKWIQRRKAELLPVPYFHVVFTIPAELNALALQNQAVVYKLLFDTTARTLETIAGDPKHLGARIGFFSVLHTWGQNLLHHPHVHCVATGGGLSVRENSWVACRPGFFLSVRVLSRLFRRFFLKALANAFLRGKLHFFGEQTPARASFPQLLTALNEREWVVYAKRPFGGPEQVVEYLGRYTHRVAISNQRLRAIDHGHIAFDYKDYRSGDRHKTRNMQLTAEEFIRRFLLHTLPAGFQRIRHYGLLASRNKSRNLALARALLGVADSVLPSIQDSTECVRVLLAPFLRCPQCRIGEMLRVEILPAIRFNPWNTS